MKDALRLPAELTIYTVAQLRSEWLACLDFRPEATSSDADDCVRMEASAVIDIDAAGVQLLASLSAALRLRRRALRLEHPSPRLVDACRALGLASLLDAADLAGALQ